MRYKIPISVIIPCYNSEGYISQAIQSTLGQSFKQFELIIVNDGSTDHTEFEIKKFKDSRIRYHKFVKNKGNYAARNYGISLSQGKYICMMDSDDIALSDRLELQFNYLEKNASVGCIGGLSFLTDLNCSYLGTIKRPLDYSAIKVSLLQNNFVTHPTIMLRSYLIKKYQLFYNEKYVYAGDYDFVVRASRLFTIRNLNKVLIKYRLHPNQISSSKRIEQESFADQIRIQQLKFFGISLTELDKYLYLKLIKGKYINDQNLENCEELLNKLYVANRGKGLYNANLLYDFFDNLLKLAVRNNSLLSPSSL